MRDALHISLSRLGHRGRAITTTADRLADPSFALNGNGNHHVRTRHFSDGIEVTLVIKAFIDLTRTSSAVVAYRTGPYHGVEAAGPHKGSVESLAFPLVDVNTPPAMCLHYLEELFAGRNEAPLAETLVGMDRQPLLGFCTTMPLRPSETGNGPRGQLMAQVGLGRGPEVALNLEAFAKERA